MGNAAGQQYSGTPVGSGQPQMGLSEGQHLLCVQQEAFGNGQQRSSSKVFVAYLLLKVKVPEMMK